MTDRYKKFTVYITRISRCIRKIKNIEMIEYNLKSPHVSILYNLYLFNSLTSKDLCDKCEEDKATISRTINYLEVNDFITCIDKNKKRYNSLFFLTDKGKMVGEEITNKINSILEQVNVCLSEEERVEFYNYLSKISDRLEEITDNLKK